MLKDRSAKVMKKTSKQRMNQTALKSCVSKITRPSFLLALKAEESHYCNNRATPSDGHKKKSTKRKSRTNSFSSDGHQKRLRKGEDDDCQRNCGLIKGAKGWELNIQTVFVPHDIWYYILVQLAFIQPVKPAAKQLLTCGKLSRKEHSALLSQSILLSPEVVPTTKSYKGNPFSRIFSNVSLLLNFLFVCFFQPFSKFSFFNFHFLFFENFFLISQEQSPIFFTNFQIK